jgi:transposase
MHKNRPDLLGDEPLILHDNARPHLRKVVTDLLSKYEWEVLPHAPYSPDMNPPDFDLFHKLKESTHGHYFPSLEEVSAAVTRAIRGLNKSGTLNRIANVPKRWDAVIEKQGEYIEGL